MTGQPTNRRTKQTTISHLLLLGVLLLAAALRLSRLDLTEFKADEAGIARAALAVAHEGRFPAVGPSSSQGPAHPPLHIYLMALPFAFTQDPRLAVAVVALIHTAAVGMAYLLGRRFFDQRVGLIAAFLFAVNPWAIYYARKMWTQNWPLATTLFISSLLLLVAERRPGDTRTNPRPEPAGGSAKPLLGAFLALVALVGTHLGGLAFIAILLLTLLLFPSRVQRRPLVVGALIFVLLALPYLYHDATHDWASLRGWLDLGGGSAQVNLKAAQFAAWLTSGTHYQDLAGARHQQFLDGLPDLWWLDVIEMALLGAGLVYLIARIFWHARAGREHWRRSAGRDVVLLSWLLIPVLLQIRHSQPVYPHYFILLYPAQHLAIALLLSDGLDWLTRRFGPHVGRWSAVGLALLIVGIGGWQVYVQQSFMNFVAQYDTPGGYGPVVGPSWRTARIAGDTAAGDGAEILVVAQGDDPIWDNRPAALDVLLPRHLPHRLVDGQEALVFPLGPTIYVTTPEVKEPTATLQTQAHTTLVAQVDAPGEAPFGVFRRSNASRNDVLAEMTPLESPERLANGVVLLAYRFGGDLRSGGTVQFSLAWWLDGPPPAAADYHSFAHLVDDDGERWGQHDLAGFPTASWRSGDLVLTRFQIETDAEAPPGEYRVNLGMYAYPDVVNVPLLDAAGNPASDFATVGPVVLR